jgi:type VI secretion system protein ImpC
VLALSENRMNAKLVPDFMENVTTPDQLELWELSKLNTSLNRTRGTGRPTKKERRDLDAFTDVPFFADGFDFEEEVSGTNHSRYCWANSAYAMATNINRSFKYYGWCTSIRGVESGGIVEDLPVHIFPSDDGGVDLKCPTEIAISDRREAELAKNGLIPLIYRKNSDLAAFIGAQSLQKPIEYYDPDATANANLAARLPYLFACCRFAHYLKCIVRDKIGSFKERKDVERWLNNWIMNYVDGDPANSTEAVKAMKPLAAAEVVVEDIEDNPGYYNAKFFLRPHYQLEGLTVSLRLVSKLPSVKGAKA